MIKGGQEKRIVQARNQEEDWNFEPNGQVAEENIQKLPKFKEDLAAFWGLKGITAQPQKAQN